MKPLRRIILEYIRENRLFVRGDRVLVALSGGADSMALLDILASLTELRLQLVVAHMNHMLRGPEADGDEEHAAATAAAYNLPFVSLRVDVALFAKERGLTLEEAGREARYAFFRDAAREHDCRVIAIGHHQDDQAETFLLRLLRGAGGSGLSAMRPASVAGTLVRPLLCVSRCELEDYLRLKGISWREDASNADTAFLRNRVRHELMPALESFNPAVAATLSQTAEIIAADEELLETLATEAFERLFTVANSRGVASVAALLAESRALRLRLIRKGVAAAKGDLRRISFRHIAAIEALLSSPRPGGGLSLPCGVKVKRIYGDIVFTTAETLPIPAGFQLEIKTAGVYDLPCGGTLQVQRLQSVVAGGSADTLVLDAATVTLPLTVRYFREGDRFNPLGMSGSKKLKDLFIDRKTPLELRRRTPLLLENGAIIWVCGVQASSRVAGRSDGVRSQSLVISYAA